MEWANMITVFRVADITSNCSTRERGRLVYPALVEFFRAGSAAGAELVISFEGVDLVTPSFLDETILNLVRAEPKGEVTLRAIRDFPVRSLERLLKATGSTVEVHRESEGVYKVAAA
jgi:hypothetical protein